VPLRVYRKASASFRVFGPALDPLDVTLALQLPPDYSHRVGEPRFQRSRDGTPSVVSVFKIGLWSMSSEQWVNSPRLAIHLEWLLVQLEPRISEIASFRRDGIQMDFYCYSMGSAIEPPSLPQLIRSRADALGVSIEIDHDRIDDPEPGQR
jgi:hypothetical protein